jgi:hypothetical protein
MFPVSYVSVPIAMPEGRAALVAFTDAEDRSRGERLRREHEAILTAQRRVATLVAGGAAFGGGVRGDRRRGRPVIHM